MDDTKTFAEMFEESYATPKHFSVGEKVEATIVKISPEWVFVDLGAKSEGYIDKKEFLDEAGELTVKEGDTVTAYFLSSRHSEKLFTTKLLARKSVDEFLVNAYTNAIPLEATVEKEVKGGFSVRISPGASGFCPFSQMDRRKIDNAADYVGKKFEFIVIEYGENGRKIILSRRPILEKIEQEKKAVLRESLQKGMTIKGVVTSVRDFGAFVDIGGVQALLPVSEMTWGRVEDTRALYKPGDVVETVIIALDWEKDRITLSFKDTLPDPWNEAIRNYPEGSIHRGKVARLTDFGAFITLEAGVDGLLHISKLGKGKKIKHAQDVLSKDREIDVKIEKVDRDSKKISLTLAETGEETKSGREEGGDYKSYLPRAPKTMGTLGDILSKAKKQK
ncbi:MAG: 30S ribosomal protein S1 [Smithellaceae bacterium]|nr:30S ribosomal protein S1 [Syntrophaceae bacterium]MDD4240480.1 30S ribosomal protein S1 [Smithellaceae bacterium]NLX50741.1 30S ribosomal protein S1 [Deltaproteobacteria bacterium]